MKLTKKKVFVGALAVCLIAIISMGSLAWFSATDDVTNKFYIATSDDSTDPDDIFSVAVWEETPDDEKDEDGYEYGDILPGDVLKKVAHVENTGAYDQYIRVVVTVSNAEAWKNLFGLTGGNVVPLTDIVGGLDDTLWDPTGANWDEANDEFYYVLYYTGTLTPGENVTVFENVKIPEDMTVDAAAAFDGGFSVKVVAQAVQTENVGDSPYEAFQTVGMAVR